MASTRTDIHRPSAPEFDPEQYVLVGVYDFGTSEEAIADRRRHLADLTKIRANGYTQGGSTAGSCGHCGAMFRFGALLIHQPSMEYIYAGEQCLENRFDGTKEDFAALRANAAAGAKRRKLDAVFAELCERHPGLAYATYAHNIGDVGGVREEDDEWGGWQWRRNTRWADRARKDWALNTLGDLAWKARKYGDISDKQVALVEKLLGELTVADVELAAREAEEAAKPPVPALTAGRQVITGTVQSSKWVENDFGGTVKITVKLDNGQRVYGSLPRALWGQGDDPDEKGRRVTFTAAVQPSDDDPGFGFYTRPTKAQWL